MNEIQTTMLSLLPSKKKTTPSGWISFNAVCCAYNNERADNRQRGGLLINNDGGFQYHCFNCQFKAGWSPGKLLSKNTKKLFLWLGLQESELNKLNLITLKNKDIETINTIKKYEIKEKKLPKNTLLIKEWLTTDLSQEHATALIEIVKYLDSRNFNLDWYDWAWSPDPGFKDRIIIPFYDNKKIVGWTGRKIVAGNPKYFTESQTGVIFNIDNQTEDKKFLIIVEGPFDAIAIDAVAVLHNEINDVQAKRIKDLNKTTIIVPDKDKAGIKLINAALRNNWTVSYPDWGPGIKDVADAVKHYGRLYTLQTILEYRETNLLKIEILKKKLEQTL